MKKSEILAFFDNQNVVILSTMDAAGVPQTRALINIRNKNIAPHLTEFFKKDNRILLITNTHHEKITQIRANSLSSLYAYDAQFNGLLLTGKTVEVLDEKTKNALWDNSWLMYYPDGKDGGDFSVIEFIPDEFKSYSNFAVTKGKIEA